MKSRLLVLLLINAGLGSADWYWTSHVGGTQGWRVFDDFRFAGPSSLTGVSWRGIYSNETNSYYNTTSWTFTIYADSGGVPGAVLYSLGIPDAQVERTFLGYTSEPRPLYDFHFVFPSAFAAAGGTRYWFSIVSFATIFSPAFVWSEGAAGGDDQCLQEPTNGSGTPTGPRVARQANRMFVFDIHHTVTSDPIGRTVIIDGSTYTTPAGFDWQAGSSHTIGTPSPQSAGAGARYTLNSWSDSGAQSHTVAPLTATTYTATFNLQYLLSTFSSPSGCATIGASPSSADGYYTSSASLQLTALPSSSYNFGSWSGDAGGSANPVSVTMNGPRSVTANCVAKPTVGLTVTLQGFWTQSSNGFQYNTKVLLINPTSGVLHVTTPVLVGFASLPAGVSAAACSLCGTGQTLFQGSDFAPGTTTLLYSQSFFGTTAGQQPQNPPTSSPDIVSPPPPVMGPARPQSCASYSFLETNVSFTAQAGQRDVAVLVPDSACGWSISSVENNGFLTVTNSSGGQSADELLHLTVPQNLTGQNRTAKVNLAAANSTAGSVSVTQSGSLTGNACVLAITPATSTTIAASGDIRKINISAEPGCSWQAAPSDQWLTMLSGTPGSGDGVLRFRAQPNTDASPRTARITIGGLQYSITQAAASCTFDISGPAIPTLAALSAAYKLDITTSPDCQWSATAAPSWVILTGVTSGKGNGSVNFTLPNNADANPRAGSITVGGQWWQFVQKSLQPALPFTDVSTAHIFFDAISLLKLNNVSPGCGGSKYCPEDPMTRSEMAAFLIRALFGENFDYTRLPYFTDVSLNHPYFAYIQKLRDIGVTNGCTTTTYCPDATVTRGQMAAFVVRARLGITFADTPPFLLTPLFADVSTADIFFGYIQKLKELGVTNGCTTTTYCPGDNTTRGQMAVFLVRGFLAQ